ncbi:zinc finger BED domain-containing protein RICESLEEPER 2 [Tanacetum coccineum]
MGAEEFTKFNILSWWKGRESQFPDLAAMAQDLLSAQASTVASEFDFSISGKVLSIRITRLTPASSEMCELDIEEQLHDVEVKTGFAISLSDEEIVLDSEARSSEAEEEDHNLEEVLTWLVICTLKFLIGTLNVQAVKARCTSM